jgi:5'-3' exonuclease
VDKDLAQCVREDRVVQVDRKAKVIRNAKAVTEKFGVDPLHIPDYLALVGDAADGFPGLAGVGPVTAARLINQHGAVEAFPESVLSGKRRAQALLFKTLATLKTDAPLFADVDELEWHGAPDAFAACATQLADERLLARARKATPEPL